MRQLIEALDDVARFAHVDPATTDAATIVQGVDMVEKKLLKALGGAGLEIINPVGETFDPALHEAVATEPTSARGKTITSSHACISPDTCSSRSCFGPRAWS